MKLFELYAELGLDATKFSSGVKDASKKGKSLADTLKNGIGGATNAAGRGISATAVMMGNLMSSAVKKGASMVKDLASTGLDYNNTMETYVTNFTTMLGGSADKATEFTKGLETMAAKTPFAMSDLADAAQTLLSFGQSSDTVQATLQSLGDIAMGDATRLSSLTLAFAQASSSGKLMGQDLMQMINAGFNPLQTIVDKTGVSMSDLKDFMSNGKASADLKKQMKTAQKEVEQLGDRASDGARLLAQMAEEGVISAETLGMIFQMETGPGGRYYKAMENASQTFKGMLSTLQDDSAALLGKVFKPMSEYIKSDLMPKAQSFIATVNKGFEVGGIKGAWSAAVGSIKTYMDDLGATALDAGSGLLASVLSGLTGDTVNKEQIKGFFTGLWSDASAGLEGIKAAGSGFLSGLYASLTADEGGNRQNIIQYFSDLWADVGKTAESAGSAASDLLGQLYTFLTGKEATAENVGATTGQAARTAGTFVTNAVDAVATAVDGMAESLEGVNTDDAEKRTNGIAKMLEGAGKGATTILEAYAGVADLFLGEGGTEQLMGKISGFDAARAKKAAELGVTLDELDRMGVSTASTSGNTAAAIKRGTQGYHEDPMYWQQQKAVTEGNAEVLKSQTELIQMIGNMWGDTSLLGLTEAQLESWMTIISSGKKDSEYVSTAQLVMEAFKRYEKTDSEEEAAPQTTSIVVNVSVSGEDVAAIVEPMVTNGVSGILMRQFRQAGLITA